jgi:hypothetical protein
VTYHWVSVNYLQKCDYGKTQPKMSMFVCFINLYHVQNILCKGHHSISNILWVITFWNIGKLGKKLFLYIFEVWIKELYWNTIHFNDIRCYFKALLNIFLHFGIDKMYQRGIFTKKRGASLLKKNLFFCFSPFIRILPGDFGRVFP